MKEYDSVDVIEKFFGAFAEAEFVPESSQYGGDSSTSFFVELVKGESGEWLIDSFPTG